MISIIAPSSACKDFRQNQNILDQAVALLKKHGLDTEFEDGIFSESALRDSKNAPNLSFFAAPKELRLKHFIKALQDPKIKIIWAFRGGYGATEFMLECLDIVPTVPKILIGFSDITALHLLFQHYDLPSIHGNVLNSIISKKQPIDDILKLLLADQNILKIKSINSNSHQKTISGKITGGNLTVFCNMLGTKLHPDTEGKILIFEDVNEPAYKIHRSLIHLKNAQIFDKAKAVILGDFTGGDEECDQAIEHFCLHHIGNLPTYRIENFGHGEINQPILFNVDAVIDQNELIFKGLDFYKDAE